MMKQKEGRYKVDLGLKWVDDKIVMPELKEEVLKSDILKTKKQKI